MSTGPRVVEKPKTVWQSGSPELTAYMNTVYLPSHMNANGDAQNTLIYQRKGNVGIATQLYGTCDTLLFGLLQNRPVQSRPFVSVYRLVNAPGIPSHFFSFPIFNFTFPATLPSGSGLCFLSPSSTELYRYSHVIDVSNSSVPLIDVNITSRIPGLTNDMFFADAYPSTAVISTSISLIRFISTRISFLSFVDRLNETSSRLSRSSWYPICLRSLLQPSPFFHTFLDPFLPLFSEHFVIGMHVRMGGNYSNWNDKHIDMSEERVLEKREAIDAILHEHPDARILLATDTPEMEYRFDSIYPGIVKTVGDLPRMHSGSVTSEAGLMRTYLELLLLGQCDVLFLTKRSALSRAIRYVNAKSPQVFFF